MAVCVGVLVGVSVGVAVLVGVFVGVDVRVGVGVFVGVLVGATPVPARPNVPFAVCPLVTVIASVAVRLPAPLGANVTFTVQLPFVPPTLAGTLPPHVLDTAKSPAFVPAFPVVKVAALVSEFEIVMVCAVLVVPTVRAVNVSVLPEAGAYVTLTAVSAWYTGAAAAVGVAPTAVAVAGGATAAPSAFKTLIRPNRSPGTASTAPRI
jgi:hypothetical protein